MTTPAPLHPDVFREGLVEAWLEAHPREERAHAVEDTRWRHSHAGKCSRFLQYKQLGIEPSEPFTPTALWVFAVGQLVHDEWQAALADQFGDDVELELGLPSVWMDGSCSLDGKVTFLDGSIIAIEIKSINGMGYKAAVGALSRPAEGPRSSAKLQAAMNACSTPGAIGAYVIYVALEAVSPSIAAKKGFDELDRFIKVWWIPIEECIALATPEFERLTKIGEWLDEHNHGDDVYEWIPRKIPDPDIPANARITDPSSGAWQLTSRNAEGVLQVVDLGNTWHCNYCEFQSRCQTDG